MTVKSSSKKSAQAPKGTPTPQNTVMTPSPETVEETKTIETPEDPVEETETEETQETPTKARKSPEVLQEELAQARKNYRRTCEFTVTKTHTREIGIVRSARLDKRTDFIQYRIEITAGEMMGRVYGKAWDSKDLEWLS